MKAEQPATPLGSGTVATLAVRAPDYDRSGLRPAIVHLGVGGFHRAHLATFVHELCEAGNRDWSIIGAGVLPSDEDMARVLGEQDGLYTLITRGADHTDVEVIGSLVDYLWAWPDPAQLIETIAAAPTQIVSLSITEGGYPVDDASGAFLPDSPLAGSASAFGVLVAGLDRRRTTEQGPVTVLSCDNIMSNGDVTRTATMGVASAVSPELAAWIDEFVSFPNSMVDRITPATAPTDKTWLVENAGLQDGWPVVTEPFRQWVVEDRFAGDRPPLEQLDVIVTDDVEPYEHLKLRLLNAGHSCLAYLAALEGTESVHEAMATPHILQFLESFLAIEAQPVLPPVAGIDVDDYVQTLLERFANPAIGDQISRLCLDGSAKFPKFLLPTVRAQLAGDGSVHFAALALAGWCEYLSRGVRDGDTVSPDPLLDVALDRAQASLDDPGAFLDFEQVFGADLVTDDRFRAAFAAGLTALRANGVRSAIEMLLTNGQSPN